MHPTEHAWYSHQQARLETQQRTLNDANNTTIFFSQCEISYLLIQVWRQHLLSEGGGRRLPEVDYPRLVLTDVVHQHHATAWKTKHSTGFDIVHLSNQIRS